MAEFNGNEITFTTTAPNAFGEDQPRSIDVTYNFGETIEDAIAMFGAEVVHSGFVDASKVSIQALIRRMLNGGKDSEGNKISYTDEQILAKVAEWKPGVSQRGSSDKLAKVKELLGKMTPEQREALLASLQG